MPFVWVNSGVRIPPEEQSTIKTPRVVELHNNRIEGSDPPGFQGIPSFQRPPGFPGFAVFPKQPGGHDLPEPITFAKRLAQQVYHKTQSPLPERHMIIEAHEIMSSPVITLPPATTLYQAWVLIRDHRYRHIPIISPEGLPLGILSDRILLREAVNLQRDIIHSDDAGDPAQTVASLIAGPILTALPHARIHQIAQALFEHHIGAMPIVDEGTHLVGIITRSDILRALIHLGPLELWG
jgi:CBS domain-containing protein